MGFGQTATPDKASEHVKLMVTGVEVLTPLAFGVGEIAAVIVGGVLSILVVTLKGADVFPAASTACPQVDWLAPSAVTSTGEGHVCTPDPASEQVKAIVTLELFHPAEFGAGVAEAVMAGAMESVLNVSEIATAGLPERSATVN
jgi:hypothetical protein